MSKTNKPSHIAYVVTPVKGSDKSIWRSVGAVWPHGNGKGFDVVIHDQLSVSGRIVCTEPKDKVEVVEAAAEAPAEA